MELLEKIQPLYTVYYYTDFLYRVVKFKRNRGGVPLPSEQSGYETPERFSQSYSRSRSKVLQYALCNKWDYFITITVSDAHFDRYDLPSIKAALSRWFIEYRRQYGHIAYLLVAEQHKDSAWHFHGFISGIAPEHVTQFVVGIHPYKLIKAGYVNFPLLAADFGFVSMGALKNPTAAGFYVTKYITKGMSADYYQHCYLHSRGLKVALPVADCYYYNSALEECLSFETDFCSCGWAKDKDFTFPLNYEPREFDDDFFSLKPMPELPPFPEFSGDFEFEQMCLFSSL